MSDNSALQFTARKRSSRLPQDSNISTLERSKLVTLLANLTATKAHSAETNLALQMSRLMGLTDSISLARDLAHLPSSVSESLLNTNVISVQTDVLASREKMLGVISASFLHGDEVAAIHVPSASAGMKLEALLSYQPYQRFYITQQVEMAASVDSLRQRVRDNLAAFSVEMHQLAELDKIVDQSLAIQARKLFNTTPKLLEQRFEQLRGIHLNSQANGDESSDGDELNDWLAQEGWLTLFYCDMRELLLAELDVRLQPVLGLLEALNEQVLENHD